MQPIKNRSVLILGAAESISGIGNWITMMAIFALVIFQRDGSTTESSGIFLAGLLPMLVFSPLAGRAADRFDRKKVLIAGELLACTAVVGLMLVDDLILIYVLLAIQSSFVALIMPARQAAIPSLVSRDNLTQTNAFLQQLAGMVKIGAPILAGGLLTLMTPHQAMVLDVASFILAAVILTRLPALPPQLEAESEEAEAEAEAESGQPMKRTLFGVLRDIPLLALLFVVMFLGLLVIMGFDVLSAILTRDVLEGDEGLYGLMIGLVGIGSVVATAWLMFRKGKHEPWWDVIWGMLLLGSIPAVIVMATVLDGVTLRRVVVMGGCLVGGVGNGLILTQTGTLLQTLSPAAWLGRVGGAFQATMVGAQLISLLTLPFIVPGLLSVSWFFAVATVNITLLVLGAIIGVRYFSHREIVKEKHKEQHSVVVG